MIILHTDELFVIKEQNKNVYYTKTYVYSAKNEIWLQSVFGT